MTGRHLSEDDLMLLHYDELAAADEREARAHVDACADCRVKQKELEQLLAMVDDCEAPEPDATFESQVWRRLQPALRAERRPVRTGVSGPAARLAVGPGAGSMGAGRRRRGARHGRVRRGTVLAGVADGAGRAPSAAGQTGRCAPRARAAQRARRSLRSDRGDARGAGRHGAGRSRQHRRPSSGAPAICWRRRASIGAPP